MDATATDADRIDPLAWPADTTPAGALDVGMIEAVHRSDPDGHIVFHRKTGKAFPHVQSIRVRNLAQWIPQLLDELRLDSYMSVNLFAPPGPRHVRTADMCRTLCANFVDADHYKLGLSFEASVAVLYGAVAGHLLPAPSVVARSGRGAYALWVYAERTPATAEAVRLWNEIQARLVGLLERIGADPKAKDLARVLRTPGSYHSRAAARVHYVPSLTAAGDMIAYTLDDMFALVQVPVTWPPPPTLPEARPRELPSIKAQAAGEPMPEGSLYPGDDLPEGDRPQWRGPRARLWDLCRIAEGRGGLAEETCRHFWLMRFAQSLAQMGIHGAKVYALVALANERACRPPQEPREVHDACRAIEKPWMLASGQRPRQTRSDTIAAELGVSAAEARKLNLRVIMPPAERQRRQAEQRQATEARKRHKQDDRQARRERIRALYADWQATGRIPRNGWLAGELGVSPETVRRDCLALGLPIARRGRPGKP